MREQLSPNRDARTRPVDLIVLHYTGMQDFETALARLSDATPTARGYPGPWQPPETPSETPLGRVSAHYLVAEDGEVWRLVPEEERAWHAGAGVWRGEAALNDRSIGIELANGGHDYGLPYFPESQVGALIALLQEIAARRGLRPEQIVGHSDVAPERKADPGERFPWARLAAAGLSIWPKAPAPEAFRGREAAPGDRGPAVLAVQGALAAFGYGMRETGEFDAQTEACVRAFQRRFRPLRVDGAADALTLALLHDLLAQRTR